MRLRARSCSGLPTRLSLAAASSSALGRTCRRRHRLPCRLHRRHRRQRHQDLLHRRLRRPKRLRSAPTRASEIHTMPRMALATTAARAPSTRTASTAPTARTAACAQSVHLCHPAHLLRLRTRLQRPSAAPLMSSWHGMTRCLLDSFPFTGRRNVFHGEPVPLIGANKSHIDLRPTSHSPCRLPPRLATHRTCRGWLRRPSSRSPECAR